MKFRTAFLALVLVAAIVLGSFAFLAVAQEQAAEAADIAEAVVAAPEAADIAEAAVAAAADDDAPSIVEAAVAAAADDVPTTAEAAVADQPAADDVPTVAEAAVADQPAADDVPTVAEAAVEEKPVEQAAKPAPAEVDEKDVIVLDNSNFDTLVVAANEPWFVEFYAPWCGWCKKLVPIYAELATTLKGKVNVGKVDATQHIALRKRFEVRGFPTIKFLYNGKMYDYHKERTVEEFVKFAESGYKEIETPADIPAPPPLWKQIQDDIYIKMLPMEKWVEYHIWPFTLITFSTGIVLGMLFSMMCCRGKKDKVKTE